MILLCWLLTCHLNPLGPAKLGSVELALARFGPVEVALVELGPLELGPMDLALADLEFRAGSGTWWLTLSRNSELIAWGNNYIGC